MNVKSPATTTDTTDPPRLPDLLAATAPDRDAVREALFAYARAVFGDEWQSVSLAVMPKDGRGRIISGFRA